MIPPSTLNDCPVMFRAPGDARKTASAATSDFSVTVGYRNDTPSSGREDIQDLQGGIKRLGGQLDVGRPRDHDPLERASVLKPSGSFKEKVAERDVALDLHDPRTIHWTRNTEEPGHAPILTATSATVPGDHWRNRGEGLDVAHHGPLPPESRFGRKRRLRPRRGSLALDRRQKRALLSVDESTRPTPDLHMERERRAEDAVADQVCCLSFGEGPSHPLEREPRRPVD